MDTSNDSILSAIKSQNLNYIIEQIINNPVSHVDRVEFLSKLYHVSQEDIRKGNYSVTKSERKSLALKRIHKITAETATFSFVSGIPGGVAIAASIPTDIAQNMVFSIRLSQEMAYIYDYDSVLDDEGNMDVDGLTLFLGIMFGANGAASLTRVASVNAAKYTANKIAKTALMKTWWYPVLKNISKVVAAKTLTKQGLAKGAAKVVPILGGFASGGLTAVTMEVTAKKLNDELLKGYGEAYDETQYKNDLKIIEGQFEEIQK